MISWDEVNWGLIYDFKKHKTKFWSIRTQFQKKRFSIVKKIKEGDDGENNMDKLHYLTCKDIVGIPFRMNVASYITIG